MDCPCDYTPPMMMWNKHNIKEDNSTYFAVRDPLLTNNICECIKAEQQQAELYFENFGMFDQVDQCVNFALNKNIDRIKNRNQMKTIEMGFINTLFKFEKENIVNINKNNSREIEMQIDIDGNAVFSPVYKSENEKAEFRSVEISSLPEAVTYVSEPQKEKESHDVEPITNVDVSQQIKIDKIEISENNNENIQRIDDKITPLINMIKSETVYKQIPEEEKESTQFNERK